MILQNPPEYLLLPIHSLVAFARIGSRQLAVEGIDWYTFIIALEFGRVE